MVSAARLRTVSPVASNSRRARSAKPAIPIALSSSYAVAPGTTVWIIDVGDSPATAPTYFPIVNGSDTDFVDPFAMTILGNPAHQPFTPIIMQHLTGNPASVPANQLWGAHNGTTP